MYADLAVFSDVETITESAAVVRLLCQQRGRVLLLVPKRDRDLERERSLMDTVAGSGIHVSLDAIDPTELGAGLPPRIANCRAVTVVRSAGSDLCLGVLERALLKFSRVPVWFWNSDVAEQVRIVVACDPDPQDSRRDALNRATVDLAMELASRSQGAIFIANAFGQDGGKEMRSDAFPGGDAEEFGSARREREAARRKSLEPLASRCRARDIPVEAWVREGAVDNVVHAICAERQASVLVVGTMRRGGLAALVRPNTAVALASGFGGTVAVVPARGTDSKQGGRRRGRAGAGVAFA